MNLYEPTEKMSFTEYYAWLQERPNELRREIIRQLEVSEKTFYNKLNGTRPFLYPEKVVISNIIEKPFEELFPEVSYNSMADTEEKGMESIDDCK